MQDYKTYVKDLCLKSLGLHEKCKTELFLLVNLPVVGWFVFLKTLLSIDLVKCLKHLWKALKDMLSFKHLTLSQERCFHEVLSMYFPSIHTNFAIINFNFFFLFHLKSF